MLGRVTTVFSSGNFSVWCETTKLSYLCRLTDLAESFAARRNDWVNFELTLGSRSHVGQVTRSGAQRGAGAGKTAGGGVSSSVAAK